MRKALLPMLASLLVCGTAIAALIISSAQAGQAARKPVMVMMAQNDSAATRPPASPPPDMDDNMRGPRGGSFCKDMVARKAGQLAYLETKLQLTDAQAPLFARWQQVSLDTARRHESECTARMGQMRQGRADAVERLDREEARLKRRLSDIQAQRPALSTLYAALSPSQKQDFGRGEGRRMGGRGQKMMGAMGQGREMGRRFGRGPAGEPPLPLPAQ